MTNEQCRHLIIERYPQSSDDYQCQQCLEPFVVRPAAEPSAEFNAFRDLIENWAKAYPLDVFPEPDFKRVREVLSAAGLSLDCISASNMRHVIERVHDQFQAAFGSSLNRGEGP